MDQRRTIRESIHDLFQQHDLLHQLMVLVVNNGGGSSQKVHELSHLGPKNTNRCPVRGSLMGIPSLDVQRSPPAQFLDVTRATKWKCGLRQARFFRG